MDFDKLNLETFINGVVCGHDYYEPIDENYDLNFIVEIYDDNISVNYSWIKGIIPGTNDNPIYSKEPDKIIETGYFIISKKDSLRKLTKEVVDAINVVCEYKFNEEIEK